MGTGEFGRTKCRELMRNVASMPFFALWGMCEAGLLVENGVGL